jgi:hypothetical protein
VKSQQYRNTAAPAGSDMSRASWSDGAFFVEFRSVPLRETLPADPIALTNLFMLLRL